MIETMSAVDIHGRWPPVGTRVRPVPSDGLGLLLVGVGVAVLHACMDLLPCCSAVLCGAVGPLAEDPLSPGCRLDSQWWEWPSPSCRRHSSKE